MTTDNTDIAAKFTKLADLLEIEGANEFRVRAYRNAARTIGGLAKNIDDLIKAGMKLEDLPGIGKDLAEKILTIITTGELPLLKEIESRLPSILSDLMEIEGLGPKRIQILYKKLHIKNVDELKIAIAKGRLKKLHGFAEKTEQKILAGIEHLNMEIKRYKLSDMFPVVDGLISHLRKCKEVIQVVCAGSFRRYKETIGDLDILVATKHRKKVINFFISFPEVANIISQGTTRAAVRLNSGIQVDLRAIPEKSYGAALLYFTGSKEHNIAIRKIGIQKKLKINEYGVYKKTKKIAGKTETEVYQSIGLPFIEPELREERGEITAAKNDQLPKLIALKDIRGDLHCHSNTTDGDTLPIILAQAEKMGYEYIALIDDAVRLAFKQGFVKKALQLQTKMNDQIQKNFQKITLLKTIEVDILEDGTFDLADDILKNFDIVLGAIHSKFNLPLKQQTERILRAMDHPHLHILAHPTERLINHRAPCALDMERLLIAAKDRGIIMELNADPDRLDLNDIHCKLAKEIGVKIAISSGARRQSELSYMKYGIYQARRGWLEKNDVINTKPIDSVRQLLQR